MDFNALAGLRLLSLRLMNVGSHPAWVDASTPQIATYAANLELAEPTGCVQVRPCEVSVPNQYPALGIELCDWPESPSIQSWNGVERSVSMPDQLAQLIPAQIREVHIWDSMGEGVTSALDLVLSTGVTLTLRHVLPPMMLGLDVRATKDMSSNPTFQRTASPPLN